MKCVNHVQSNMLKNVTYILLFGLKMGIAGNWDVKTILPFESNDPKIGKSSPVGIRIHGKGEVIHASCALFIANTSYRATVKRTQWQYTNSRQLVLLLLLHAAASVARIYDVTSAQTENGQ